MASNRTTNGTADNGFPHGTRSCLGLRIARVVRPSEKDRRLSTPTRLYIPPSPTLMLSPFSPSYFPVHCSSQPSICSLATSIFHLFSTSIDLPDNLAFLPRCRQSCLPSRNKPAGRVRTSIRGYAGASTGETAKDAAPSSPRATTAKIASGIVTRAS